jgi:hypothetical protein
MDVPSWFARCFASSLVTFNFFVNASRAEVSRLEFESHLIRQPTVEKLSQCSLCKAPQEPEKRKQSALGFLFSLVATAIIAIKALVQSAAVLQIFAIKRRANVPTVA